MSGDLRIVFDTNVIVSGRLWGGVCADALRLAEQTAVVMIMSEAMVDELHDVLQRPKFAARLRKKGLTAEEVVALQLQGSELVEAVSLPLIIQDDPDDDMVLACALGGNAQLIVSGDGHLLKLGEYRDVQVLAVHDYLKRIQDDRRQASQ